MAFPLDLKAIAYGLAVFAGGYVAMSILGTAIVAIDGPKPSKLSWMLVTMVGYLVPVAAGFVTAYFASTRRILQGTIGGTVGAPIMLLPALLVPSYPFWGVPIVIASYAVLASLGAIFGNHIRSKVRP